MPAPPTNEAVRTARVALATADDEHAAGLDRFSRAAATLADERRLRPGTIHETAAELEFGEANRSLTEDLRPALLARRQELSARITEWLDGISIDAEIARLDATVPIVFLPVRVETRFDRSTSPGVLKVRIFPDEIFISTLEERLRPEEVEAAKRYYIDADKPTTEMPGLQQWREIVTLMSPERAAWVLRVMEPTRDAQGQIVSFPSPPLASQEWTRPSQAVVPDRWIVVTYRGPLVRRYKSNPVIEPLITGVDPTHGPGDQVDVPGSNPLLKIDDAILWTVDYARAVANGMAVTIDLETPDEAADLTGGFDRIVVFGVKTSMTPADGGAHLQDVLDAQHHTKGLGLVPQGTPTNNTENAPTPLPRDAQSARTFLEERAGGLTSHGQVQTTTRSGDVKELAALLGIADGVFPNILPPTLPGGDSVSAHLAGEECVRGRAMNRALWPILFGYYLDNFIRGQGVPVIAHDDARRYFVGNVRARGPVPAFRTGKVPYGLLPVVAYSKWQGIGETSDELLEEKLIDVIRRLAEQWRRASENVPRLKPNPNVQEAYKDLLRVIALHPSAREMRIREVYGPSLQFNLSQLSGTDYATIAGSTAKLSNAALNRVGLQTWKNAILMGLASNAQSSQIVTDFVVPPDQLSEETFLPSGNNYIGGMMNAPDPPQPTISVEEILNNSQAFGGLNSTLFYKVLRHSVLAEITRIAAGIVGPQVIRLADTETYGVRSDQLVTPSTTQLLKRKDFPQSGGKTMGDFARSQKPFVDATQGERSMEGALRVLAGTQTAELDRLFAETTDLASHRLDAWITAFATRRAFEMRASQAGAFPHASHLGGYAFVENVRPAVTVPGPIETQPFSGGLVQTPSLAHATAAAILRSGYMSYKQEDPQKYAVDLSSDRVRGAREIMDAVRAGTPLGEVLGQIFERRLHKNAAQLNRFRYALRLRYPLNVGTMTPLAPGETADRVAARNVVDGLKLWMAFRQGQIPWGQPDLNATATERAAIEAEIKVVEENVDRVADLVLAESVFQLGRGNVTSAVGHMDALARGNSPSEPEISQSARVGPGLTQRVALVFPDGTGGSAANWPMVLTPRATVEKTLDEWVSRVLGDPTKVACAVTLADSGGATSTKTVKLSELAFDDGAGPKRLRPLDVMALAREATVANQGSTLDRWIGAAALRDEIGLTVSSISFAPQQGFRTFPEVLEIARALSELLAGARSLEPADLATSSDGAARREEVENAAKNSADALLALAENARTTLETVADDLRAAGDAFSFRNALQAAAAYLPTLFPPPEASAEEMAFSRDAAVAELDRRTTEAEAVTPNGPSAAATAEAATEKLRFIFGRDFLSLLSFPVPGKEEIRQSLEARDTLLGTGGAGEITKFLQRASQVQEGLARWRSLSLYFGLGVTGVPRPRIDVVQMPFTAGDRWVALPLEGADAPRGKTSLLLMSDGPAAPSTTVPWRGVVIDGWVEVIPNKTEDTGVAFNFDYPIAEAAQAVLVAVPPAAGTTWSYDWMLATLSETFDLARIRTVDRELIDLGQLLPTSYLARDFVTNTISTTFPNQLRVRTTGTLGS